MNKPTLFFSHSSKDKDMILTIKNKLMSATGGVLDIFMSSDGQSIPFGTNWIHKIEEGLNDAKIMFVFVTENSLPSGWIYFETGFAYNKGIKVIPVGIGVDIGALKAPLNLLQGFNITSGDSLNNFVTVVNREFDYKFPEQFTADDYQSVVQYAIAPEDRGYSFDRIVRSVDFRLRATETYIGGGKRSYDVKEYFDRIIVFLKESGIPFSYANPYYHSDGQCIMVRGIKICFNKSAAVTIGRNGDVIDSSTIWFRVSPYMFEESFELCQSLFKLMDGVETFYIHIRLKDDYRYHVRQEDCAALLMSDAGWFTCLKDQVGRFECKKLNLTFGIFNANEDGEEDYVLGIGYDPKNIEAKNITKLVAKLCELKVIHDRSEE